MSRQPSENTSREPARYHPDEIRACLSDEEVMALCERVVGHPVEGSLRDWSLEPIGGGLGGSQVFRISGKLGAGDEVQSWSAFLKILSETSATHGHSADGWKREALLYTEGLLSELYGGLRAPECLSLRCVSDSEIWLWLEDVTESEQQSWSLKRYARAAYHLGQVNGYFRAHRRPPRHSWLLHGFERHAIQGLGDGTSLVAALDHEYLGSLLTTTEREGIRDLWRRRELVLELLFDILPQTFGHMDSGRFNLFSNGEDETIAIDWGCSGTGPVGQELKLLVFNSFWFQSLGEGYELHELYEAAWPAYLEGLRNAGWDEDPESVQYACAGVAAVNAVRLWPLLYSAVEDSARRSRIENLVRRPFSETVDRTVSLTGVALDMYARTRDIEARLQCR